MLQTTAFSLILKGKSIFNENKYLNTRPTLWARPTPHKPSRFVIFKNFFLIRILISWAWKTYLMIGENNLRWNRVKSRLIGVKKSISQFSNSKGTIVRRYDWCWEITRFGVERAYCSSFLTTRCHCGFSHRAIFSEALSQQTEQDVDKYSLKQFDENWKGNSCFDLLRLLFLWIYSLFNPFPLDQIICSDDMVGLNAVVRNFPPLLRVPAARLILFWNIWQKW